MWWPSTLVQVSLFRSGSPGLLIHSFASSMHTVINMYVYYYCILGFCRALHEKEKKPKGAITRNQFFLLSLILGAVYCTFPGYLFTMLTSVSWICWLAPKSVLVQQLGSGFKGLGIAAFGFDWATISSYLGSPLASPWFATANIAVAFFFIMYVMTPVTYWWSNAFHAKNFPIYSRELFNLDGSLYNISSIINSNFNLDKNAYSKTGPLYMSTFFSMTYGLGFAALPATLVHVLCFNGRYVLYCTPFSIINSRTHTL